MTRQRFDKHRKIWVEVEPGLRPPEPGAGPHLWPDLKGYRSPVTGEWIDGRRARREDLKRNHCVEYDHAGSWRKPRRGD